jgi:hypothetical protein
MQMTTRHRWKEVEGFMPDDFVNPEMEIQHVDTSWIDLRTIENFNEREWQYLRETNWDFVRRFSYLRRRKRFSRNMNHGRSDSARDF